MSERDERSGAEPAPPAGEGLSSSSASSSFMRPTEPVPMRQCPRCGQLASLLDDGTCARCRSLVAAKTIPFAVSTKDSLLHLSRSAKFAAEAFDGSDQLQPLLADPLIGVVVADRYRIVELLGRGGMGIVYKVEHVRIGKLLAMKLLTGELSRNAEVVRRFKHEALTASKLSSPNTVQVFDYGVAEGLTYLVMELVTGDDLGRLLKAESMLPQARVGRIVVQVASSLAEAHQKGIVHRDVKPENVMLLKARDGTDLVKVLDFGLAKLREGAELSELTSAGAIVGTPYYMSPEQVRGDPVDPRSDIYSLGALMYRALTGQFPFNGPTPMSVFAKHLTEEAVPPSEIAPAVSSGMSEVVMRSLRKDPGERFQRVEDLQAAVVGELSELGTSGIEALLDSGALRSMAPPPQIAEAQDAPRLATRDEVESYERKLRRTRIGVTLLASVVPLAAVGWGAHYVFVERPAAFGGVEREPNDTAGEANVVPFGKSVTAQLGKRLSATQGDIDFFAVEVPDANPVTLGLTSLPNMPLCLQLFRRGQTAPTAQYCGGRPGLDLEVRALRLEPGPYLAAVIQDLDARGGDGSPFIYENVSDSYVLHLGPADPPDGSELEPNDSTFAAQPISPDQTVTGTLGWVNDVDVICPKVQGAGSYRFRVEDEPREGGGVLSVALEAASGLGPAVRVHASKSVKTTSTDAPSPFIAPTFQASSPPCIVLRAVTNPGDDKRGDQVPRGSRAHYRVTLEPAP